MEKDFVEKDESNTHNATTAPSASARDRSNSHTALTPQFDSSQIKQMKDATSVQKTTEPLSDSHQSSPAATVPKPHKDTSKTWTAAAVPYTAASKCPKAKSRITKVNAQQQQPIPAAFSSFNLHLKKSTNIPNADTPKGYTSPSPYNGRHPPYGFGYGGGGNYVGPKQPSAKAPPVSPVCHNHASTHSTTENGFSLHPLQTAWCLWVPMDKIHNEVWKDRMKEAFVFSNVEDFWGMHKHIHSPTALGPGLADYYLFRKGITPDWNDRVFHNGGGRFVIQLQSRNRILDEVWLTVILLLIGEGYDTSDDSICVCGAVVSCRAKLTKIALWVATSDPSKILEIASLFFGTITKQVASSNTTVDTKQELKHDLKPEFESFRKNTLLDVFFQSQQEKQEKLVVSWADMTYIKPKDKAKGKS